ncbi:hypothetical protein WN51_04069 [Melipona quadrifasciata]|uniref:Uncharacterized protein n=1 Tax=Melipona quadrifasciata TaxID=166423 RepID=A0A0M8ZS95_9HYME|nr:hypothetical protein WN51_04069 [Melipona quadrifasciata]
MRFYSSHGRMDRCRGGCTPHTSRQTRGADSCSSHVCTRPHVNKTFARVCAVSTRVLVFLIGSLALLKERTSNVSLIEHEESYNEFFV